MTCLPGDGRRVLGYALSPSGELTIPFEQEPFVATIWASDQSFCAKKRFEVAVSLIQAGCRYSVCGGENCEAWHDDADLAWVNLSVELGAGQEMPMVVTTWHFGESEEEVVSFARDLTNFAEHEFTNFLVLVAGEGVANEARVERLIQLFRESQ